MRRIYEPDAYDTETPVASWWESSARNAPAGATCPPASGELKTDVAVIGGGFTGLNAALQLAKAHGREVLLLEAATPGWGASGRNGGFACLGGAGLSSGAQIRRFGLTETQKFMALQISAIAQVRQNLAQYGIDADTHSDGEVMLAHKPSAYGAMLNEAAFHKRHFAIDYQAIPRAELAAFGIDGPRFYGAVRARAGFALNPMKYAQGLALAAVRAGVRVCANSAVSGITRDKSGFHLETAGASIHARKIIVATNGYSSEDIPETLGGRYLPLVSTILVTRPITPREQAAQGWNSDWMAYDSRHLLHYFRLMPDGRFLFGQRGALRVTPAATAAATRANRRDFEALFPAWSGVEHTHHWSGLLCLTRNRVPFIGPLDSTPGAFAALGYHGNGVAMASMAGRLLGDIVAGKKPDMPGFLSRPLAPFRPRLMRRQALRAAYLKYSLQDRFF